MIVHFNNAEQSLIATMREIKRHVTAWRAVHVKIPQKTVEWDSDLLQEVIMKMEGEIPTPRQPQYFFCSQGHLFILVRGSRLEELKVIEKKILSIMAPQDGHREIHSQIMDLSVKWNSLNDFVESLKSHLSKKPHEKNISIEERITQILNKIDMDHAKGQLKTRHKRKDIHILIAEDDEFTQRIISNVLSDYKLIKASDGAEVLTNYILNAPDMVFLDINLPTIDGHKLLDEILTFDQDAFVVMLSGNTQITNVTRSMDAGAKGFVAKPFPKEKLQNYAKICESVKRTRLETVEGF